MTGVQIGMTFTAATIGKVVPYFIPFLLFTFFIMIISIASGILLARIAKISKKTGVLGSIPGGLSVMVAMSDSMEANTGL
ncbi:AbrB family transcriptional regulator [Gracilibacillus sp. JCM 18860]|uniref:AbrB family transcriptional regulator n=1 Tax=Gracilibacillus sp. JCM 18860 TaxID=1306159 RepID=UPI0032613063